MTIQFDRNWVNSIRVSMPDYGTELVDQIQDAMTNHTLDDIDAHCCALAAALAMGYGELAFEITMSKVMFGNDVREEVIKSVLHETTVDTFLSYAVAVEKTIDAFPKTDGHVSSEKHLMYRLAASIALRSDDAIKNNIRMLKQFGINEDQLNSIARIASVIPAIGRCVI